MQYNPNCTGSRAIASCRPWSTPIGQRYDMDQKGALPATPPTFNIVETVRSFLQCRPDADGHPMSFVKSEPHAHNWVKFWIVTPEEADYLCSNGYVPVFHSSRIECMYSIILSKQLLPSHYKTLGHVFYDGKPGVYMYPFPQQARSHVHMKWTDLRGDGTFYSVKFEAMAHPTDRIHCRNPDEWVQTQGTGHLIAFWVRALHWKELQVVDCVQGLWDPMREVPPICHPYNEGYMEGGTATAAATSNPTGTQPIAELPMQPRLGPAQVDHLDANQPRYSPAAGFAGAGGFLDRDSQLLQHPETTAAAATSVSTGKPEAPAKTQFPPLLPAGELPAKNTTAAGGAPAKKPPPPPPPHGAVAGKPNQIQPPPTAGGTSCPGAPPLPVHGLVHDGQLVPAVLPMASHSVADYCVARFPSQPRRVAAAQVAARNGLLGTNPSAFHSPESLGGVPVKTPFGQQLGGQQLHNPFTHPHTSGKALPPSNLGHMLAPHCPPPNSTAAGSLGGHPQDQDGISWQETSSSQGCWKGWIGRESAGREGSASSSSWDTCSHRGEGSRAGVSRVSGGTRDSGGGGRAGQASSSGGDRGGGGGQTQGHCTGFGERQSRAGSDRQSKMQGEPSGTGWVARGGRGLGEWGGGGGGGGGTGWEAGWGAVWEAGWATGWHEQQGPGWREQPAAGLRKQQGAGLGEQQDEGCRTHRWVSRFCDVGGTEGPGSNAFELTDPNLPRTPDTVHKEMQEVEEFEHEDKERDSEFPPNLNIASLREVSPGVWAAISDEEHLDKLTGLLLRLQRHINAWKLNPLQKVQGHTVLPPLEASSKSKLHSEPMITPATS